MMMGKILRVNLTTQANYGGAVPGRPGAAVHGRGGRGHQAAVRRGGSPGGRPGPGQQADCEHRLPGRDLGADLQPRGLRGQVASLGDGGLRQLRGLLPQRAPGDRRASHHRGRQGRGPRVPLDRRQQGRDPRRAGILGAQHHRYATLYAAGAPRRQHPHRLYRAGRRAPGQVRRDHQRATGRRTEGAGGGDGGQEPEGHRRARKPGPAAAGRPGGVSRRRSRSSTRP